MIFPITIAKSIVLKQSDFNISSEKYILSHIEDHMGQFGMVKKRYSNNELFYMKLDPFRLNRRKDHIGNISFTVNCNEEEIRIKLKTNTILILLPFVLLTVGVSLSLHSMPSTNINKSFAWFLLFLDLMVFGWIFLIRILAINRFKNEIVTIMQTLRK